jgi:flavin-dependent dehydrogenase
LEAVPYGWWYAARIPDDTLLIGLYSTAEIIKSENLNQLDAWISHLNATPNTQILTVGLEPIDERPKGFQAPSFRLDKVAGENWLAIGDTASSYDPITAQGIIKSMTNAFSAAAMILKKQEGHINDFSGYTQEIDHLYAQYLEMRRYFYNLERRWPDSIFWKKLHEV